MPTTSGFCNPRHLSGHVFQQFKEIYENLKNGSVLRLMFTKSRGMQCYCVKALITPIAVEYSECIKGQLSSNLIIRKSVVFIDGRFL